MTEDSPTQKVGGAPTGRFPQVEHLLPMISLANARNEDELRAWETRLHNRLGQEGITREQFEYVVEGKIDGLAISLIYRDGKLERGVTRGNGVIGEDVTANLLTMSDVPRELPTKTPPALFEARGEVYIKRSDFHALNEQRAEEGHATYANPRNTAAGSIRQIDVELTTSRPLSLWGYGVGALEGIAFENHSEELDQLREWGFPVNDFEVLTGVDDVAAACHRWEERREGLDYEIDGAVVKVNETDLMRRAGVSGREPRGAIAWKFPPMEETTTLLVDPVERRPHRAARAAGGDGAGERFRRDRPARDAAQRGRPGHQGHPRGRRGDRHACWRCDPARGRSDARGREEEGSRRAAAPPAICPACDTPTVKVGDWTICPNRRGCPGQRFQHFKHFVSRAAMDIDGLGEKQVQQFLEWGWFESLADIYELASHREELLEKPGYKEKSVDTLLASIEQSKQQPFWRVLFAIGIHGIGGVNAKNLAGRFGSIDAIAAATTEEIAETNGIGPILAENIAEQLAEPEERGADRAAARVRAAAGRRRAGIV